VRPADRLATAVLRGLPAGPGLGSVRRDDCTIVGCAPDEVVVADGAEALRVLDHLASGFWVGWCAFELGHTIEPTGIAGHGAHAEAARVPDLVFARFDTHAAIRPDGSVTLAGDGRGRPALEHAVAAAVVRPDRPEGGESLPHSSRAWRSSLGWDEFSARVDEVHDLLAAGECYQVNLTRQLECDGAIDPVALHRAIATSHDAPYTTLLSLDVRGRRVAVVSASPERFLRRAGRAVQTRPIKGTASDPARLRASAKDRAENVMIVDLARNDLGRVCVPGSIQVPDLCAVEAHPGLHHLVSTVDGVLRADVGLGELLGATFPPASVTGAPKPRVLRAIDELEPVRRGVYCGAVGWVDTTTDEADLAVAIRTFTVHGHGPEGTTELGVGSGIVADSEATAEWDETELKASRLLRLAGAAESEDNEEPLTPVAAS
jgi:para-aminobenzoate synthetase component 1